MQKTSRSVVPFIEEENVPRDRDGVSRDPGGVGGTPSPPPLRGPPQDLHVTWEGGLYIERRFDSVFPRFLLKYVVQSLYNNHRTAHQWVVAFKGGHVEKDLLRELKIPFVNLVDYNCPKVKDLLTEGYRPILDCGHHLHSHTHLPQSRMQLFWEKP